MIFMSNQQKTSDAIAESSPALRRGRQRRRRERAASASTKPESSRRASVMALLLDEGTFEELDKFVAHRSEDFGMQERRRPATDSSPASVASLAA